jgi:hypothetical protein
LDSQLRILFDRTTWPTTQHQSYDIHPSHCGWQKGLCGLGAVERIVQTKGPLGVTRRRAHGDIVSKRDHREEQDYQH